MAAMTEPVAAPDQTAPMTEVFDAVYRGEPWNSRQWDIGAPSPPTSPFEEAEFIGGAVVNTGCGTGEDALHLAGKGYADDAGLDLSPTAISLSQTAAGARGLDAVSKSPTPSTWSWEGRFDRNDFQGLARHRGRTLRSYAAALHRACRRGRWRASSRSATGGPRRCRRASPRPSRRYRRRFRTTTSRPASSAPRAACAALADGWTVESMGDPASGASSGPHPELLDVHA